MKIVSLRAYELIENSSYGDEMTTKATDFMKHIKMMRL